MNKKNTEEKASANLGDESAFKLVCEGVNKALSEQFKILLETKHLYQKVSVPFTEIVNSARSRTVSGLRDRFDARIQNLPKTILLADWPLHAIDRSSNEPILQLTIVATNIKLYCEKCSRVEAFKPIWWTEVANDLRKPSQRHAVSDIPFTFQLWLIVYRCQACLGLPQGMLVRRNSWSLSLEGRSPIEYVEVPQNIPRQETNWFRDALIAKNTGKVLAALFYLRTFLEQFARRQTGIDGRVTGTEIMEKYADLLPTEHRGHMPSLKEWYDKLSEALHGATEDAQLFDSAQKEIERHFDIRRVFRIPESAPQITAPLKEDVGKTEKGA